MKILVPGNVPFDTVPELDDPNDVAVAYSSDQPISAEDLDADALVTWSLAPARLKDMAQKLTALRWAQTLTAGSEHLVAAGFAPEVTITAGIGLHDTMVTEHTLALILSSVRRLDQMHEAQRRHVWDTKLMVDQTDVEDGPTFSLDGARITIWGFGSIAKRLAPHLVALGAQVTGVANTAGDRNGFPVDAASDLEAILPETDILVSLIPGSPQTEQALSTHLLSLLPPHARFVNAGRGKTVDEDALVTALTTGRLAGAALDVTATEPLPADSPLWDAPNMIITPHVAGGRPQGVKQFLTDQVRAFKSGGPAALANIVPR